MPNCPYCGKEIGEDHRYCLHCENDLSEIVDKKDKEQHKALAEPFKDLIKLIKNNIKKLTEKKKK